MALPGSESALHRLVISYGKVCRGEGKAVNAGKSKITIVKRKRKPNT